MKGQKLHIYTCVNELLEGQSEIFFFKLIRQN